MKFILPILSVMVVASAMNASENVEEKYWMIRRLEAILYQQKVVSEFEKKNPELSKRMDEHIAEMSKPYTPPKKQYNPWDDAKAPQKSLPSVVYTEENSPWLAEVNKKLKEQNAKKKNDGS